MQAVLWRQYVEEKQTLAQLSQTHGKSVRWIHTQLGTYELPPRSLQPQPTVIIADAFYDRRGSGTMLFRSPSLHENLLWFPIAYETTVDYVRGVDELERAGWVIQAFVMDGRKGVREALEARFPVQMCHFHQVQIVTRYLTRNPQLEAAQALKALTATLTHTTRAAFEAALNEWYTRWGDVVTERTVSDERTKTGRKRWWYTHRRLRSAYRSLRTNLSYLFTYEQYPYLQIPHTTNSLDGSISHLRDKLGVHRGLKIQQRRKITGALLKKKSPSICH